MIKHFMVWFANTFCGSNLMLLPVPFVISMSQRADKYQTIHELWKECYYQSEGRRKKLHRHYQLRRRKYQKLNGEYSSLKAKNEKLESRVKFLEAELEFLRGTRI